MPGRGREGVMHSTPPARRGRRRHRGGIVRSHRLTSGTRQDARASRRSPHPLRSPRRSRRRTPAAGLGTARPPPEWEARPVSSTPRLGLQPDGATRGGHKRGGRAARRRLTPTAASCAPRGFRPFRTLRTAFCRPSSPRESAACSRPTPRMYTASRGEGGAAHHRGPVLHATLTTSFGLETAEHLGGVALSLGAHPRGTPGEVGTPPR